jgi:hypothetical protein
VRRKQAQNKARTTAFHPQANGGAERIIRNIKPNLAKYIDFDQENWDVYLPLAISAYNNSYHSSIGMTPFEAHFCRPSVKLHDIILNNPLPSSTKPKDIREFTLGLWNSAETIRTRVRQNIDDAHAEQKRLYDRVLHHNREYPVHSQVLIRNHADHSIGLSKCFEPKFTGPFVIVAIKDVTYTIRDTTSGKIQTVHYNRLIPFHERGYENEDLSDEMSGRLLASRRVAYIATHLS